MFPPLDRIKPKSLIFSLIIIIIYIYLLMFYFSFIFIIIVIWRIRIILISDQLITSRDWVIVAFMIMIF